MDFGPHFAFGTHPRHGIVAAFTPSMPAHLARWFLVREQFEPVPGHPRLFRLTQPERDGPRRARQAVQDLRRHGYAVHADMALDPATSSNPPPPRRSNGPSDRRTRLAQAAVSRTRQRRTAATASPPSTPPRPAYAPTAHLHAAGRPR